MAARRVLIVEDDTMLSQMQRDLLVMAGFDASVLNNLLDALKRETWIGIDAAVVDLWLSPPMHGTEIMTFLASDFPQVRRVLVTADDEAPQAARDLAHVVLIKPYAGPTLIQSLG
jgi:DNA-binding NtrC family response regulator